MAIPKNIQRLLDRMEELEELHERALLYEDLDAARRYGDEYLEFLTNHQQELRLSDKTLDELRNWRIKAGIEHLKEREMRQETPEAKIKAEKARQEYLDSLLELPPQGKKRTEH